jgi:hypothetical protein
MMASGSKEMKRKSTDDGGVSPPPLRRKVQSMTTRKICLYRSPAQILPGRVQLLYVGKLTLHQKLLWLHSSLLSPKNRQRRRFGKSVHLATILVAHYSLENMSRMIEVNSLYLGKPVRGSLK